MDKGHQKPEYGADTGTWYYTMPFAVMKLSGNVEKFSQGVMTNTLRAGRNAFIDIYGRIVAVCYQKVSGSGLYIAFNEKYSSKLQSHLAIYLKLGKMSLEPAGMKAYFVSGKSAQEPIAGLKIPEKNSTILLSGTPPAGMRELTENEFNCLRLENGISVQGKEFEDEMIMNTDWSDAVSFTKGCFLGQEIVVKVSQRGKPPKRLVRMIFASEPKKITRGTFEVGEVRSKCFSERRGKWLAYCSIPNDGLGVDGGEILTAHSN